MSQTPFIKLHYGAYESNGIIRHKAQRLHGVIQCLTKLGYEIEIVPSVHLNRLSVEMLGREIYRCDLRNLMFNIECEENLVCKRLVEIVEEAAKRMYSDDNLPQFCPLSRGKRIIQEMKYAETTQDLFPSNIKLWFEIPKNSVTAFLESMEKAGDEIQEESDIEVYNLDPYERKEENNVETKEENNIDMYKIKEENSAKEYQIKEENNVNLY